MNFLLDRPEQWERCATDRRRCGVTAGAAPREQRDEEHEITKGEWR